MPRLIFGGIKFFEKNSKNPQVPERAAVTGSDKGKWVSKMRQKYFSKTLKFP